METKIHEIKEKFKSKAKPAHLEGIWKGIEISELDINKAKRSLFKDAYNNDIA